MRHALAGTRVASSTERRSRPLSILLALAIMSCGGGHGDGVGPPVPMSIAITPATPAPVAAGGSVQIAATVLDARGQPIAAAPITFSSGTPRIATVTATGLVTSLGPVGTATITAASGSVSGNTVLTVVPGPAALLSKVTKELSPVAAGSSYPDGVQVVVTDAFGNPRPGSAVTFVVAAGGGRVSQTTVQTDAHGRASTTFTTGSTAGVNTLTVTAEGLAPLTYSVTTYVPGSEPIVTGILPSLLTPGIAATITGTGFGGTAAENRVTVDGVSAAIASATPTELAITVPATVPCAATHRAVVAITVNSITGKGTQLMRVGVPRTIPVGGTVVVTAPEELACSELPDGPGQYVVSVFSNALAPSTVTPYRLEGNGGGPSQGAVVATTIPQPLLSSAAARPLAEDAFPPVQSDAAHLRLLTQNRAILASFRGRFAHGKTVPRFSAAAASTPTPGLAVVLGETKLFRISKLPSTPGTSICASYDEVTTKAVYVSPRTIIYEDVSAPLVGTMDTYFDRLGQEFDATMYRSDSVNFGDPLATNSGTNGAGHLMMVFSPAVNRIGGVAGFVVSCDFFPRNKTNNLASNLGEIFYARVPTAVGTGFKADTPDSWLWQIRSTVVHEVKHIASFGARLVNNANEDEEIWLEEGLARHAEEVWLRDAIYHVGWKGNATYENSVYCDFPRPGCTGKPFGMLRHFADLYVYLTAPAQHSPFGPVSDGDGTYYASAWSFVRWTLDRYGSSDATFLRALTQSLISGTRNLTAQAGHPLDELLGNWTLSLYLARNSAFTSNADVQFPTWDARSIFSGMSGDFSQYFPKPFPLVPAQLPVGDFAVSNTGVHGGSFAMYEMSGQAAGGRAVGLRASGGGPAAPVLRMAIARVR